MSEPKVEVILEIKRPVKVEAMSAVAEAITKTYGEDVFLRQVGEHFQLVREVKETESDE